MRNFFQRIKRILALKVTDPKAWDPSLWNLRGAQSVSGETVTEETALTYSAVWNAISLISGTVSSLPLHLMQKIGRNRELSDQNSLYFLLHDRPNKFMTAMAFRETMTAHVLSWGNCYAEKQTDAMGDIIALWPIPPNRVLHIEMREDEQLWYEIKLETENKWLPRSQILHVPGLGFDGFIGYSPIAMARKSIGLGMAMETFGSNYFGQGTHPGVIVSHPQTLDSQTRSNLKQSLTETYSGLGQSHRLMLLEDGMKIEKVGIPPNDSQFLESRQFQVPEIARWYNLPPHKLKDLTKSSFNNIEQEQISFVIDSILPWLIRFEQNYNMQLLNERQIRREKLYFHHVVEGLLRGDAKSRALFYQIMKRNGLMTQNEIREKENLNPHDDPLADELWVEMNMAPLSRFGELLTEKIESGNETLAITTGADRNQQQNVVKLRHN